MCRNCRGRRSVKPVCRGESHPACFRHCQSREVASALSLHRFPDGGQCLVGVAAAMEEEQLAAQRQIIWATPLWQGIAARLEQLVVKVRHMDVHVPKSRANEEHQNSHQVDQAAKIEVAQVDLDWQHKGELFIARWAHDTSGHEGSDTTY